MTWHGTLHSMGQVLDISEQLARRGVQRFYVQVARSEQMLNPKIGNSGISAQDIKELRQLLALQSEAFELRE